MKLTDEEKVLKAEFLEMLEENLDIDSPEVQEWLERAEKVVTPERLRESGTKLQINEGSIKKVNLH